MIKRILLLYTKSAISTQILLICKKLPSGESNEVSMKIDSVFTTRENAESVGKVMVSDDKNNYISYYISEQLLFQ